MPSNSYAQILSDIKALRIQGAEAIARSALDALEMAVRSYENSSAEKFSQRMQQVREELFGARPTEPCLRNAIQYALAARAEADSRAILEGAKEAKRTLNHAQEQIAEYGARKIGDGMVIFTHCHSSTVVAILERAWSQGKRFTVHNTEARPLYQGRKTARELAAVGIPVKHYVDSAARVALWHADMVLFGCDAITTEGSVINKIGSNLFAEVAHRHDIPVYPATHSWKFDPGTVTGFDEAIERRSPEEVWESCDAAVDVQNVAFEYINPEFITATITDEGVLHPRVLVEEMKKKKWLFS